MLAGIWTHREIFDGTYSFEDLLDAHELLDFREENQRRAAEWDRIQKKLPL
ncbi:MAG TPA: hypothetical protein VHY56_03890 [Candidatus Binataceae bacterium]|nr:hypothetical protein [Candidatus Binataceae bacterium]